MKNKWRALDLHVLGNDSLCGKRHANNRTSSSSSSIRCYLIGHVWILLLLTITIMIHEVECLWPTCQLLTATTDINLGFVTKMNKFPYVHSRAWTEKLFLHEPIPPQQRLQKKKKKSFEHWRWRDFHTMDYYSFRFVKHIPIWTENENNNGILLNVN